ncbi:MAG: putative rane protein [Herbinix sp.]|nr:putative rane protein [Herbinix sp.]
MNEVYAWIKNIVVFMIINTIIMNLLGNSSYKKYVSIVSGMILVLIVISPVIKLLKLEDKFDYFFKSNNFTVEAGEFETDVMRMEEARRDAEFSEYTDRIKVQVGDFLSEEGVYLDNFNIDYDMDIESKDFGSIKAFNITAYYGEEKKQEDSDDSSQIEEIIIETINLGEPEEGLSEVPSPMEINIKNKLSDFYNIDPDNININIQGG